MDFDVPNLIASVLFSLIGFMYLKHGKKAVEMKFAISGILLVVFGYFTPSVPWTVGVGIILCASPFFIGRNQQL